MTKTESDYNYILEKWQEEQLITAADIDSVLYNFRILFAYNSGRIENDAINYHDTREIFDKGRISSYTGDLRTLFEQQNQKDCYEFLKNKIEEKAPLSAALIKQIHFELTKGTYDDRRYIQNGERPGEFKKKDYIVGRFEAGAHPETVESEINDLCAELNATDARNALKAGCYLHAVFENIHPFADGNGRVGRTLLNFYLITHGHPPAVIFEEDRKEYYAALEKYDGSEEIEPLYNFCKAQCVKTWAKQYRIEGRK